jgi:hypothetical protein
MAITYEDVIHSLIPNTTMQNGLLNGEHKIYNIYPNDGYVLHDKENDFIGTDPETGKEIKELWYVSGMTSCGANYDFLPVTVTDENGVEFTAYGDREFFARPKSEVIKEQF